MYFRNYWLWRTWLLKCLKDPVWKHISTRILIIILRIDGNQFKCNYLRFQKKFLGFLLHFWNSNEIFNILRIKMSLIVYIFPKLLTPKEWFFQMSKRPRFSTPFSSQHVYGFQKLVKSARQHFYYYFVALRKIELENISLSLIWNHRTVC